MRLERKFMNSKLLKLKIISVGSSAELVSNHIGIDISTFYRKLNNGNFTIKQVDAIKNYLGLSVNEFMDIFFANESHKCD